MATRPDIRIQRRYTAEPDLDRQAEALQALSATQRARDHLMANTNPQLALEVLMLDLPVLPAPSGEEAREAAPATA